MEFLSLDSSWIKFFVAQDGFVYCGAVTLLAVGGHKKKIYAIHNDNLLLLSSLKKIFAKSLKNEKFSSPLAHTPTSITNELCYSAIFFLFLK